MKGASVGRQLVVLTVAAVVVACGDAPLSGLGERFSIWIGEPEPEPSAPVAVTVATQPREPDELIPVADVEWWNDSLGSPEVAEPAAVVAEVAARRAGQERFVQASRFEIAAALPALRFPTRVPARVRAITSQLVLETTEDRLDDTTHAAFGLWQVEPYSRSRRVGQVGSLTVGSAAAVTSGPCEPPACRTVQVGEAQMVRRVAGDRETWSWELDGLHYELMLRDPVDGIAAEMVGDVNPLIDLSVVVSQTPSS